MTRCKSMNRATPKATPIRISSSTNIRDLVKPHHSGPMHSIRHEIIVHFCSLVISASACSLSSELMVRGATIEARFTKIVDTSTTIPGGAGVFQSVSSPSISGANVAFAGRDASGRYGIYKLVNGILRVVADTTTTIPGEAALFTTFDRDFEGNLVAPYPKIDGETVVFWGNRGIYLEVNGTVAVVANSRTVFSWHDADFYRAVRQFFHLRQQCSFYRLFGIP